MNHRVEPVTLSDALRGYVHRWRVKTNPAPRSIERRWEQVRALEKSGLGPRLLSELPYADVEDALVARAAKHPVAARGEGELLKRALRDAHRRGQSFDPNLLLFDSISTPSREGVALTVDELQRLGSWFPEQVRYFPEIVGSIGLRLMEALQLTDDQIDLERGTLYIPAKGCKENRDKLIELAEFEIELIRGQLRARPDTPYLFARRETQRWPAGPWRHKINFYRTVFWPAREGAAMQTRKEQGLPSDAPTRFDLLVAHDLRHTAISLMAAGGMKPELIAKRVGHSDGGRLILARYRHLFPDEMGDALAKFGAWRAERLRVEAA